MLRYGDFARVIHRESKLLLPGSNDRTAFYEGQVGRVVGVQQGVYTLLFLPEELRGMADISFFKDLILQAFAANELEKVEKRPRRGMTVNRDGSIGEWGAR